MDPQEYPENKNNQQPKEDQERKTTAAPPSPPAARSESSAPVKWSTQQYFHSLKILLFLIFYFKFDLYLEFIE
jgi:hypothetical protein